MKHFLTFLSSVLLPLACVGAPSYTTYFNNTHTYTNAAVAGAATVGSLVSTNGVTSQDLTASRASFTDSNKKLVSTGTSAALSGALSDETGSGGVAVFASNPSLAGLTSSAEIVSTLGSISADASALDATATWNNAGVTFAGLKMNITDTASAAGSMLADLQVGGSTVGRLSKTGQFATFSAAANIPGYFVFVTGDTVGRASLNVPSTGEGTLAFGSGSATRDTFLLRDAANILGMRNGTAAQTMRVYNTFTDASNYERGFLGWSANVFQLGVSVAGTGVNRGMLLGSGVTSQIEFQTSGATPWRITSAGNLIAPTDNSYDIGASGATRPRDVFVADDVVAGGDVTAGALLQNSGIRVMTPSSLQTLAAGNALLANATKVRVVGSGGAVTLTSTPTIADGSDGQYVMIQGTDDTNTLTVQDQGSLASSNLELGAATRVLGAGDVLVLTFDTTASVWYEVSFANN